jgi:uncharacterized protein YdeI (YjbR/CyaY-like superfamily)
VKARFVRSAAELRRWLDAHHADSTELVIGFYKKSSRKTGISYAEALDEALCFGWIDGVRRSVDDERYTIRFTPRKRNSIWSVVNTKRVSELIAEGRMAPPGLAAFERRDPANTHRYSYEQRLSELGPSERKIMRANRNAWDFFQAQPPSYRRVASWWVLSAKKEQTRARRLDALIAHSAKGERIPQAISPTRSRVRRPAL